VNEPLLLDTCAIVWLASRPEQFSPQVRKAIAEAPALLYCPVSAWEIALKASRGTLGLALPPRQWFSRVVEHHGLERVPLDENILFHSVELPWIHRDPADRFIIATALERDVPVVTADGRFPRTA
jgi:PIN domain nuclease of toxin-antitoxin system